MDSHNKSRQSYIALEKFWVTQCGWLQFCANVAMGITITNCWKLFFCGVKRDHHEKFIGIIEFLEWIAVYFFNNNFTTDTGTLENNILSIDDIDNKRTLCTCWSLKYSSSSYLDPKISRISDITIATAPTNYIGHKALKEVQLEVWRYNTSARGYCYMRLTNEKRCLKSCLWYFHDFSIRFQRSTYYCKYNGCDWFASHHDSIFCLLWHVLCLNFP